MTIFERVKALKFPNEHYVVVGSGVMDAKGIREAKDLDIIVTPELFNACLKDGWELKPWTKKEVPGEPWLHKKSVDLMINLHYRGQPLLAQDLIREGEIIEGVCFVKLEQLLVFKREYGRPKDFEDIKLIEAFLLK